MLAQFHNYFTSITALKTYFESMITPSPSRLSPSRSQTSQTAYRLLDAIPGGLAWLALLLTALMGIAVPHTLLTGTALLASYAAARFAVGAVAVMRGLYLIRCWETLDWRCEYERRRTQDSLPLNAVHHLVLIPAYREPPALLERTLDHLSAQRDARTAITVVLALEAADPAAHETATQLHAAYANRFAQLLITFHPANLPGEQPCKSANLAWALRQARHEVVQKQGLNPDHIVVTTMDADTIWHPHQFEALSTLFATDPARYKTFWQAPLRYHANVWQAHPLLRILHATASAWELAYLAGPWHSLPMSSYALSLRLLDSTGGWAGDAIADEWHLYLTAYFRQQGDQSVQPVYLPFHVQAVTGDTILAALRERYLQTFRHAWGAKEIGYAIAQMRRHPHIAPLRTTGLLLRVAYDNLLAGAGWIVLFLGPQLPLLLHRDVIRANLHSAPLIALQAAIAIVTLLTFSAWLLDRHLRPPRTHPHTRHERLLELASLPLVAVLTVIGVALPVLHAQTRMLRGKPIRFRVTPKM